MATQSTQARGEQQGPVADLWPGLAVAVSALLVFAWTAFPTVAGGDSGELVAAACSLGVAHPPGYPLFTLLGHMFSWLPVGSVAWRVNLLGAVSSAGSVFLLYLVVLRLTRWWPAAVLAAGTFAFSPLIWRYSTHAEVFTLNNLFATALLWLFVRQAQDGGSRTPTVFALVFGLGLTNHHTLLFVGLPLGLWLLWQERARLCRPWPLLRFLGAGVLGLTPYLYLIWASRQAPLISWGDLTTWDGFWTHFFRREYGTLQLASQGTDTLQLFAGLWHYLQSLAGHVLYLGLIPILLAIDTVIRPPSAEERQADMTRIQPRQIVFACALIPLVYLVTFHALANLPFVEGPALYRGIVSRFWLMPNIFFFVLLGWGWLALRKAWPAAERALVVLALAAVLVQCVLNFGKEDQHGNQAFADFGRELLRPVPEGALYFTLGDLNTNSVRYLQACEGWRPGVRVIDRSIMAYPWARRIIGKHYPSVVLPGIAYHPSRPGGYDFSRLFDANHARLPLYLTLVSTRPEVLESTDQRWREKYVLLPYGLAYRVIRTTDPINVQQYIDDTGGLMVDVRARFPVPPADENWEQLVYDLYWTAHYERAAMILKLAILDNFNPAHLETARQLLQELVSSHPAPPADWFKDLGLTNSHLARVGPEADRATREREMREAFRVYLATSTDRTSEIYQRIRQVVGPPPDQ